MPPATKAFDALWHCLTPSSSSPVRKYLHLAAKRSPRLSIQCFYFQLGNHISRTAIQPRAVGHNARTIHTAISRHAQQEVRLSAEEFRDHGIKRKLDEDDYHNLRQLSLEGSLPRTQRFVKYLVKDLGEEPNVRIYNAMLLANADHEHGSASEAASILEEMVTERITPDAATYHAALRV